MRTWTTLPAAPVATRPGAPLVAADGELLVPGGWPTSDGGAALSLRRRHLAEIAPLPVEPREDAVVVWAGDRLVVWGGTIVDPDGDGDAHAYDGAAYDPTTDTLGDPASGRVQRRPGADRGGVDRGGAGAGRRAGRTGGRTGHRYLRPGPDHGARGGRFRARRHP